MKIVDCMFIVSFHQDENLAWSWDAMNNQDMFEEMIKIVSEESFTEKKSCSDSWIKFAYENEIKDYLFFNGNFLGETI